MQKNLLKTNKVSKMAAAERNAWYNGLSKPQKAVAICEDVLAQIKAEKYVMTTGTYLNLVVDDNITQRTVFDIFKKEKLEDVVAARSITCQVCAMGSAFMSAVRLGNNCSTESVTEISPLNIKEENDWGSYQIVPGSEIEMNRENKELVAKLGEAFSKKEYRAMECMFEGIDIADTFTETERDILTGHHEEEYDDLSEEEMMINMCKQIIKDGGYFFIPGVDLDNTTK